MNMDDYRNVADRMQPSETCRNEVLNMNRKITQKKNRRYIPLLIAAAVAVCGTSTVLAADYFGAFEILANKHQRTYTLDNGEEARLDKYDNNNYAAIGEHLQEVTEEKIAEDQCATLYFDDVYCDGRNLVLGFTGELAEPNRRSYTVLDFDCEITINGVTYRNKDRGDTINFYRFDSTMLMDENSRSSFTGSIVLEVAQEYEFTEPTTAEIKIRNYDPNKSVLAPSEQTSDEITLSLPLVPETDLRSKCMLSAEEDGFGAKIYEISPASIVVGSIYPKEYDNMGLSCSVIALWYDENGNMMEGLTFYKSPDYGDGYKVGLYPYTDTSKLTLKLVNKQKKDENGNFPVLYEHSFDLTN